MNLPQFYVFCLLILKISIKFLVLHPYFNKKCYISLLIYLIVLTRKMNKIKVRCTYTYRVKSLVVN